MLTIIFQMGGSSTNQVIMGIEVVLLHATFALIYDNSEGNMKGIEEKS